MGTITEGDDHAVAIHGNCAGATTAFGRTANAEGQANRGITATAGAVGGGTAAGTATATNALREDAQRLLANREQVGDIEHCHAIALATTVTGTANTHREIAADALALVLGPGRGTRNADVGGG